MTCNKTKSRCLPDHPVHDEDIAQKSHHANDGVESRDGYGNDQTPGAAHRSPLPGVVLQPLPHQAVLLVRERDVEGDDGVQVGQGERTSRDRVRLHSGHGERSSRDRVGIHAAFAARSTRAAGNLLKQLGRTLEEFNRLGAEKRGPSGNRGEFSKTKKRNWRSRQALRKTTGIEEKVAPEQRSAATKRDMVLHRALCPKAVLFMAAHVPLHDSGTSQLRCPLPARCEGGGQASNLWLSIVSDTDQALLKCLNPARTIHGPSANTSAPSASASDAASISSPFTSAQSWSFLCISNINVVVYTVVLDESVECGKRFIIGETEDMVSF
ncbi:hypothetical protein FQN60_007620 [Etheostoma spectabile]|uniref:Uncharacterized protein n=1 Tax=Etheostoma spectabile TaxID=54343 RepID=A0A5J5D3D9_9PERO|nr:hypothetical protein FQN60_007620 [Etheostoma spectabile]